jgi:hypothetical protein
MSERAWVGQSGPIWLEFLNGTNNKPAVRTHITLENFGHSPAIAVFPMATLAEHDDMAKAAEINCNFARAEAGRSVPGMVGEKPKILHTGQTIFPQQSWQTTIDEPNPIGPKTRVLYAIGCVIYRDDVTHGIWWTRFCQETRRPAL